MNEKQALQHRSESSKEQRSLPQRAGRAYAHLQQVEAALARHRALVCSAPPTPKKEGNTRSRDRQVRVQMLVCPKIDYMKLASALLDMAREEQAKKDQKR